MPQNQNTLAEAVLRNIGVLGAEETADTNDTGLIKAVYANKHAEWTERGFVDWPLTGDAVNEIPDDAFETVKLLMSNEVLSAFGTPQAEDVRMSREALLLVSLRRLVAGTERSPCGNMTKKDLSTAVLRRLTIIDPLATPSNKDAAYVWSVYDSVYTRLSMQDLTYWPNVSGAEAAEIPQEVFLDMVRIVAEESAPIFNVQASPEMDDNGAMVSPGVLGKRNLRRLMGRAPTGVPTRSEYF